LFIFGEDITWSWIVGVPLFILGMVFMVIARDLESRAEKRFSGGVFVVCVWGEGNRRGRRRGRGMGEGGRKKEVI
jgi:drug/metabolite transporter (DMT)-like permease